MITTNIRPISNHNYSGNITTQSQHQITTGIMDTDTETDPIFRHSPAYGITEQDIQNWNEGAGVDLSSYVTHDFLSEQAYLTSETDPVFSASPAAGITSEDIENWNAGAGVDLSSYVTYEYLSAQSYLTSVIFPDYSNTYQSKGDYITPDVLATQSYITPSVLASQAYLTSETDPVFSASPAWSITDTDIANWNAAAGTIDMGAYVTKAQLAAQSYLTTETDPVFSASPAAGITTQDIENWNAGGAVDLSAYVTYEYLSAQSYVSATYQNNAYNINFNKTLSVRMNDEESLYPHFEILSKGTHYSSIELQSTAHYNNGVGAGFTATFTYRDNGTYSGFTWIGQDSSNGSSAVRLQDVMVELMGRRIQLGPTTLTTNPYVWLYDSGAMHIQTPGLSISSSVNLPYNYSSPAASYGFVWDNLNTYVFSQSYITPSVLASQAYLTSETDPVFSASPAAGITAQDITNWNNGAGIDLSSYVTYEYLSAQSYLTSVTFPDYSNTYQAKGDYVTNTTLANQSYVTKNELVAQSYVTNTSLSGMAYVKKSDLSAQSYVTSAALSNCGYVQIKLVTQSQYIDRQDNILYVITDAPPIS